MAHNFRNALFSALALVTLVGCPPAETTDDPTDGPTDAPADPAIVGTWLSEGDDVAPLLAMAPANIVSIDAAFMSNGDYTVTSTDVDSNEIDFTGTYTVDESTDPATIVLEQTSPTTATSEGIWRVEGGVLTYEVAQTTPDIGVTPPTPEAGFGSTSGGAFAENNVQIFR